MRRKQDNRKDKRQREREREPSLLLLLPSAHSKSAGAAVLALGSLALALAVAACGLFIFTKSSRTSHVSLSSVVCAAGTRAPRASNQKDLAMHSSLFVFVMARSSDCAVVAATNFVKLSSWVSAPAVSPSSWSRTSDTTTSYVPYGRESRVGCSRSAIYGIWQLAIGW